MSSSDDSRALIMEYMAKMPDTLNTKKEIDEYYKAGWREIKEKIKEEKGKKKVGPTKRPKKLDVDEDGNEIEKVKRPPTEYQQFMRDTKDEVKEKFPELKNNERFAKIAELWRKHKEDIAKESETKESETKESETKESDTEESDAKESDAKESDAKESNTEIIVEEEKKPQKEGKAPRKALNSKAGPKK